MHKKQESFLICKYFLFSSLQSPPQMFFFENYLKHRYFKSNIGLNFAIEEGKWVILWF